MPSHDEPTRALIRRALAIRPGAGLSDLIRLTSRGNGTIEHALYGMLKDGSIKDHGKPRQPAYFLAGRGEAAGFLLRGASLGIYAALQERGAAGIGQLAEAAGASKSEVRRVLHRLADGGFVASVPHANHHEYLFLDAPQPGARTGSGPR